MALGLVHSWVNAPLPYGGFLNQHLERAREFRGLALADTETAAHLDGKQEMKGWRYDIRTLFRHPIVSDVLRELQADVAVTPTAVQAAETYASQTDDFVSLMQGTEYYRDFERKRWEFRMHLLVERRNEIAHEAYVGGPDMTLYAKALEQALEDVLMKLADIVLHLSQQVRTIEDAIAWHRTPWEA